MGTGSLQPIHVDDLAAIVVQLVQAINLPSEPVIALGGPQTLGYLQWLLIYRQSMGLAKPVSLPIPELVMTLVASVAGRMPGTMLTSDNWHMLRAGSTADSELAGQLLGRPLRQPEDFINPDQSQLVRLQALAKTRRPVLLVAVALIWLLTALCSVLWPLQQTLELMQPLGLTQELSMLVLAVGITTDLVIGILTLYKPGRWLWLLQIGVVLFYSVIVFFAMPEWLLHPLGPIIKNLAVLTLLVLLLAEESASGRVSSEVPV